jgi:hypothetical protein
MSEASGLLFLARATRLRCISVWVPFVLDFGVKDLTEKPYCVFTARSGEFNVLFTFAGDPDSLIEPSIDVARPVPYLG